MKSKFITLLLLLSAVSCSNDNSKVLQRLNEAPATVREIQGANNLFVIELANNTNGLYSEYIVPSSALSAEYKEDGLSVLISGDVTNNFVAIDGYVSEGKGNTVTLNGLYNTVEITTMSKNEGGVYYVVGYYGIGQIDSLKGTAKAGGYLFVSESLKDSLFVSNFVFEGDEYRYGNLLDGVIDFPTESMAYPDILCEQEAFFPEEYRFAFKVQINSYRPMTEEEYKPFTGPFIANCLVYKPYRFKPVIITSYSQIQ